MVIKKKSYKEVETLKTRGKLRFLERQAQEAEADAEIKKYQLEEQEDYPENNDSIQDHIR